MIVKLFYGGQMISYIDNLQYVPSNGEDVWVNEKKYYVFDRVFKIERCKDTPEVILVCYMELATQ
jgi:hypothetical protein